MKKERKQAEAYREIAWDVLQILNEPGNMQDSIQRVLAALKTQTGFDAVGIRLQYGDDFPYFAQEGFPPDFLLTENTLIERAADGGVCRDKDDNVCLECTCGLVISGKTDPANRFFTRGGSFWTGSSLPIPDIPTGKERRLRPRDRCIHRGYASMALVPIRNKDRIVGLIHLNDRRKGCFTLETVELLEGIAAHIGAALTRMQSESQREAALEELQKVKEGYRILVENARDLIYRTDENGYFTFLNPTALKTLGYEKEEIIGKHFKIVVSPDKFKEVITFFANQLINKIPNTYYEYPIITKDGQELWIGQNLQLIMKDDRITGFQSVARDITASKQAEKKLQQQAEELLAQNHEISRFNLAAIGRELCMIELKREMNDLCGKLGEPPRYRIAEGYATPPDSTDAQA